MTRSSRGAEVSRHGPVRHELAILSTAMVGLTVAASLVIDAVL